MSPTKPKSNQPETPKIVQGRDLFQTPNYATDILVTFIPKNIELVWECAAGEGKIATRLRYHGISVFSSDIVEGGENKIINFLESSYSGIADAIITNPPYSLKKKFYVKCLEFGLPFALLIPADYSMWIIEAIKDGCEKIIPTRRVDYITPTGNKGKSSASQFHSMWLTSGFNLGKTETFVDLTNKMKENI